MMVAWSKHTGADDRSGDGAIRYFKEAFSMKRGADGKLVREERDPPPEILRGHPDLVRRAINSLNTKHVYASGVLSFHKDDIDVEKFNRADPALRQTIERLMDGFEGVMFTGIPKEMRPPLFWTTHTHTGRLELNVLVPRFVWSGKPDRNRDPDPDPDDESRRQMMKRPDHEVKQERATGRMVRGQVSPDPPTLAGNPRDELHDFIVAWVEAGRIGNRDQMLGFLKKSGYRINRVGKDYISVQTVDPARNAKAALPVIATSTRLKGPLYSEAFTDEFAAFNWLSNKVQTETQRRRLEQKRRDARKAQTEAIRQRLADLLREREAFNRQRYGGPAWKPPPPPSLELDQTIGPRPSGYRPDPWPFGRSFGTVRPLSRASATKVRLWESLYDIAMPYDIAINIRFVDTRSRKVRFFDESVVTDYGDRLIGQGNSQTIASVMALEAKAKGWTTCEINGSEEFLRASVRESIALGLVVFGETAEAEKIVAQEWEKLGGGERIRPGEESRQADTQVQDATDVQGIASEAEIGAPPGGDVPVGIPAQEPELPRPAKPPPAPAPTEQPRAPVAPKPQQTPEAITEAEPSHAAGNSGYPDESPPHSQSEMVTVPHLEPEDDQDDLSSNVSDEEPEFEEEWTPPRRRDGFGPGM